MFPIALPDEVRLVDGVLTPSIGYPVHVQPKLDGVRCVVIKRGDDVKLYSRSGEEMPWCEGLDRIRDAIAAIPYDVMLDGELMGVRDGGIPKLWVFDGMAYDDWFAKKSYFCGYRLSFLERFIAPHLANDVICIVETCHHIINDAEILAIFNKYVGEGYEGIVIKKVGSPYPFGTTRDWLKLKPRRTYEGKIVGWNKSKKGNIFASFDVEINGVVTKVCNGFQRDMASINAALCRNPFAYNGKVVEISGEHVLASGKVSNAKFVRFRERWDLRPLEK